MYYMPIKSIVDYWQRYWLNRTQELLKAEQFNNLAKSPRILIEDILSELKYNGFKNEDNRNLFRTELEEWRKEPVFKSLFNKECGSILSIWGSKLIVTSICNSIISKMDKGTYFRAVIKKLTECLESPNDFSYQNKLLIHKYSDICIVELLSKGYDLEDIHNAIIHPSVIMGEGFSVVLAPDELCGYKCSDYHSVKEYHKALSNYFAALSVEDKVNIINLHYEKEEKDAIVLVRLTGIKGEIDTFIDDINIYSLNKRQYIKDDINNNIETSNNNYKLINAAIPVKYKSEISSKNCAINKLKKILALLEIRLGTDKPISFSYDDITIVQDGKILCQFNVSLLTPNIDNEFSKTLSYYEISRYCLDISNLSQHLSTSKALSNADFLRLNNAAQWIQKAKSSEMFSDRLLYSWIAIESLIKLNKEYKEELSEKQKSDSTATIAKKVIAPIVVHNTFNYYSHYIFDLLRWNFKYNQNRYGISETVKNELYKNENEQGIPIVNLFSSLDKLKAEVKEESFINELERFEKFYNRDASGMKEYKTSILFELTMIYRLRNMIMHNAVYSIYQINYYGNRALFFACSLLNAILTISVTNQLSISDTIIKIVSDGVVFDNNMIERIENLHIG